VLEEITHAKPVFEEPRFHSEMKLTMDNYNSALTADGRGAILAAVCRGKLCEGIDFTDRQCRMVLMIGIPYPPKNDMRVTAKQAFLEGQGIEGDGHRWYNREAIRAVNQTLGRVIRHKHDFGGVVLCDSRYAKNDQLSPLAATGLSKWIRPRMSVLQSFNDALVGCGRFFGTALQRPAGHAPAAACQTTPPMQPKSSQDGPQGNIQPLSMQQSDGCALPAAPGHVAQGVQKAAGTSAVGSGGTSLSTLGALWSRTRQRNSSGANEAQPASIGCAKSGSEAPKQLMASSVNPFAKPREVSTPLSTSNSTTTKTASGTGGNIRTPATPQTASTVPSGPQATKKPATAFRNARDGPLPLVAPGGGATASAMQGRGGSVASWSQMAEGLLPQMDFQQVQGALEKMLHEAELIVAGTAVSELAILAEMRNIAELLLPELNFDTPSEARLRDQLVRDCGQLVPKLLRPLWRQQLAGLLRERGQEEHLSRLR